MGVKRFLAVGGSGAGAAGTPEPEEQPAAARLRIMKPKVAARTDRAAGRTIIVLLLAAIRATPSLSGTTRPVWLSPADDATT